MSAAAVLTPDVSVGLPHEISFAVDVRLHDRGANAGDVLPQTAAGGSGRLQQDRAQPGH